MLFGMLWACWTPPLVAQTADSLVSSELIPYLRELHGFCAMMVSNAMPAHRFDLAGGPATCSFDIARAAADVLAFIMSLAKWSMSTLRQASAAGESSICCLPHPLGAKTTMQLVQALAASRFRGRMQDGETALARCHHGASSLAGFH